MGKDFKGILICTDYDETFTSAGKIPQNNLEAVNRFMERGGLFTFSSGRGGEGSWIKSIPFVPNTANVPYSFELAMPGVNKGSGIARLRNIIKPKLPVCVGDYLGDIAMLKEADIGYAVENAHPAVREAADRVTVHSSKGAIAQIINDLENSI